MPVLTIWNTPSDVLVEVDSVQDNAAIELQVQGNSQEFNRYTQDVGSKATEIIIELPEHDEQQQLVSRAQEGDKEAFGEIVHQYSTLMLRTAWMIVGDRDIAEDTVQDALIQAWQHLPNLREASALRPWLMRIVVNQCISFKRRLARSTAFIRQALSDQATDLAAQVADDHKGRIERDWDIASAIEHLPAKQRAVIVLHYYQGMTLSEMSETLQTSENTLKKRIQAALANLRRVLHTDTDEGLDNSRGQPGSAIGNSRHTDLPQLVALAS